MKRKKILGKEKNKEQTSKKSKGKEAKESSELEKEIEETEETIDDNEFIEFIQPSTQEFINISAPVLERVETPQQESLEQDIASTPVSSNANEGQIDYSTTLNEPNYSAGQEIKYQTNINPPTLRSAEISENLPRQELLDPMAEIRFNPQDNMNMSPEIVNTEFIQEKRRLPFERDDKKYKEFRL